MTVGLGGGRREAGESPSAGPVRRARGDPGGGGTVGYQE